MEPGDAASRQTLAHRAAMVPPDPHRLPQLVVEVLGTGRLPYALTKIIARPFSYG